MRVTALILLCIAGVAVPAAALLLANHGVSSDAIEYASYWVTWLTPTLVVVSALLVVWQVADTRKSILIQQFEATGERLASLSALMVENADLYPYFYEGASIGPHDPVDVQRRVRIIGERWLDAADGELLRRELFRSDLPDAPPLTPWITDMFHKAPILKTLLNENTSWYRDEILDIAGVPHP